MAAVLAAAGKVLTDATGHLRERAVSTDQRVTLPAST